VIELTETLAVVMVMIVAAHMLRRGAMVQWWKHLGR